MIFFGDNGVLDAYLISLSTDI